MPEVVIRGPPTQMLRYNRFMDRAAYPALEDFSVEALLSLAQDNYERSFTMAFGENPAFHGTSEFGRLLTGLPFSFGNMVFARRVPIPEQSVRSISERLKSAGVPALWWVGPYSEPPTLPDLLIDNGWEGPRPSPIMVADLASISAKFPAGLEVRPVRTTRDLADWRMALTRGLGLPAEGAQLFELMSNDLAEYYTGFMDAQAIATSAVFFYGGMAGIYCVSTAEEYRGRGIGAAVTAIALAVAREKGYRIGTLQSSAMGHSVYRKLGFWDIGVVNIFTFGVR